MLKKHSQIFNSILIVQDLLITAASWISAYLIRVKSGLFTLTKGTPEFRLYLQLLPFVLILAHLAYRYCALYRPRRVGTLLRECWDIVKANLALYLILPSFIFFYAGADYSRLVVLLFPGINIILLFGSRVTIRLALRHLRSKGWNSRSALIVGAGKIGQRLACTIARNPWSGIQVIGFLDHRPSRIGKRFFNVPVWGPISDLKKILETKNIDQVYITLPLQIHHRLGEIIDDLSEAVVDVRVVPDVSSFATLNKTVWDFEGLPIICLRESPLYGWNLMLKRVLDIVLSILALVIFALPMLIIAIIIKLTSPGPLFYRQERMGLDGRLFSMIKFRSMKVDAEAQTGAVWAQRNDSRRTPFGSFLRRTSLDELPQFINVLKGEMSIVGPRPERPVFIEKFKKEIPSYMLRHKMKAGITGWAQVNGWRGNTSLKKRIQYDLYYIENWSVGFDLWIIFLTAFKGLINPNAY